MSDNALYDTIREALVELRNAATSDRLGFQENSDAHLEKAAAKLHDAIRNHTRAVARALAETIARS